MSRADDYQSYLRSAEWKSLRVLVMRRAGGNCEMCGEPARHVHHVKYPKQFKDDDERNLLALCESCHMRSHGMSFERKESNVIPIKGRSATFEIRSIEHADDVWLCMLDFIQAIISDSIAMGKRDGGTPAAFTYLEKEMEPDEWMYADIMVDGIRKTLKFINDMGAGRLSQANYACAAAKNARQFYKQLHKEHKRKNSGELQLPATVAADITAAAVDMAALGDAIGRHLAPIFGQQNLRFERVEAHIPTLRPAEESITVTEALIEKSKNPNNLIPGTRLNLETYIGNELKKRGYQKTGTRKSRLSGRSIIIDANTYQRGDVYAVIDSVSEEIKQMVC